MKVKSESEVAQSCPTVSNPMDCGPPGSSTHGIFQARVLEWGAIAFSEDPTNRKVLQKKKKIIIFPGAPSKEHRPRLWPSENCVRSLTCRSLGEHLSMACGEGSPRKVLIGLFLLGTSLVVQWLRLHAPSAGGLGSIPGQGTRSHVLQVLVSCCNQDPAQSNK